MAHRVFADASGVIWEAWEVRPRGVVEGAPGRRAADTLAPHDSSRTPAVPSLPAASERRLAVTPALQGGWLAFRAGDERRRLAPIPPGWECAPDEVLNQYCLAAAAVRTPARTERVPGSRPTD